MLVNISSGELIPGTNPIQYAYGPNNLANCTIVDVTATTKTSRSSFTLSIRYRDQQSQWVERILQRDVDVYEGNPVTIKGVMIPGTYQLMAKHSTGSPIVNIRGYGLPVVTADAAYRHNSYRLTNTLTTHAVNMPSGGYAVMDIFVAAPGGNVTVSIGVGPSAALAQDNYIRKDMPISPGVNNVVRNVYLQPGDRIFALANGGNADMTISGVAFSNKEELP